MLRHLAVEQRRQHSQHVGLNEGVEQGEQDAHQHRQHVAQLHIVVDQLRHQQSAEQGAEKTEAHGNGQGEFLQGPAHALEAVARDTAGQNYQIG